MSWPSKWTRSSTGAHLAVLAVEAVELASHLDARLDAAALTSHLAALAVDAVAVGRGSPRVFIFSVPRVSRDPRPQKSEHPQDPRAGLAGRPPSRWRTLRARGRMLAPDAAALLAVLALAAGSCHRCE